MMRTVYKSIALVSTLLFSTQTNAQPAFGSPQIVSKAANSGPLNFGNFIPIDYDNDGNDDIIHIQNNEIYLKLNQGGSWTDESLLFTGNEEYTRISPVADLNNDGLGDVIMGTESSLVLVELETNAVTQKTLTSVNEVGQIEIHDLNRDNVLDIVFITTDAIWAMLGKGDGEFEDKSILIPPQALDVLNKFVVVDVDADEDLDLLVFDQESDELILVEQQPDNSFRQGPGFIIGEFIFNLCSGDLNSDGFEDLLIHTNSGVGIYVNNQDLTYSFSSFLTEEVTWNVTSLTLLDYSGNGLNDLLISSRISDLNLLRGNGDGTFQDPELLITTMPRMSNVTFGDFDGDEKQDLVGTGNSFNHVVIVPLVEEPLSFINLPLRPALAEDLYHVDLDSDGFKDIILFSGNGAVFIYYGTAQNFETIPEIINSSIFTRGGNLADLNGDNLLDIIVRAGPIVSGLNVIYNQGNRNFEEDDRFSNLNVPEDVTVLGIDGDGELNIISHNFSGKEIVIFDQNFQQITTIPSINYINNAVYRDINNDQKLDIVLSLYDTALVQYYINSDTGFSDDFGTIETIHKTSYLDVEDLDGDGLAEIIVGTNQSNSDPFVEIYQNLDDTEFELKDSFSLRIDQSSFEIKNIIVKDFEDDGLKDILVGTHDFNRFNYLSHSETGFSIDRVFDEIITQGRVLLADVDDDGLPDLINTSLLSGELALSINITNTTVTGQPDNKMDENVSLIYPNPVSSQVTIDLANDINPKLIKLLDFSGRIVRTIESSESEIVIDLSRLAPGAYLITVENDVLQTASTHKILVE